MKRQLQTYDDLSAEEGEIYEESPRIPVAVTAPNPRSRTKSKPSSESEDEIDFGQRSVLPVGSFSKDFTDKDEPTSGEQYLCLVRHQRIQLPKVEVAEPQDSLGKDLNLLVKTEITSINVNREWATKYWTAYQEHRERFLIELDGVAEQEPEAFEFDKAAWFCKLYNQSSGPTMSFLASLPQEIVLKLISFHVSWMKDLCPDKSELAATWLQALLMCLDLQLTSPELSVLRSLTKVIPRTPMFNEIALVIARSYGQHDLINEVEELTVIDKVHDVNDVVDDNVQ